MNSEFPIGEHEKSLQKYRTVLYNMELPADLDDSNPSAGSIAIAELYSCGSSKRKRKTTKRNSWIGGDQSKGNKDRTENSLRKRSNPNGKVAQKRGKKCKIEG